MEIQELNYSDLHGTKGRLLYSENDDFSAVTFVGEDGVYNILRMDFKNTTMSQQEILTETLVKKYGDDFKVVMDTISSRKDGGCKDASIVFRECDETKEMLKDFHNYYMGMGFSVTVEGCELVLRWEPVKDAQAEFVWVDNLAQVSPQPNHCYAQHVLKLLDTFIPSGNRGSIGQ